VEYYYDNDDVEEAEEELIERLRARRRRRAKLRSDDEDEKFFAKVRHRVRIFSYTIKGGDYNFNLPIISNNLKLNNNLNQAKVFEYC